MNEQINNIAYFYILKSVWTLKLISDWLYAQPHYFLNLIQFLVSYLPLLAKLD